MNNYIKLMLNDPCNVSLLNIYYQSSFNVVLVIIKLNGIRTYKFAQKLFKLFAKEYRVSSEEK